MMTSNFFDNIVNGRIGKIEQTLQVKGKEYRRNNNPMHNFEQAANINSTTREQAIWSFATKHLVSIIDMIDDLATQSRPVSADTVDEKLGDLINYLILLEASIKSSLPSEIADGIQ